ncbi:tetratricopeptide repeat protein, partial [Bacteroidota bacterium]
FSEFLNVYPSDLRIMNELAFAYIKIGNFDEGINIWQNIIKINPNISDIYYNLFTAYNNKKQYNSAAYYAFKTIEKGGKVDPVKLEFLKKYRK